MRKFIIFLCVIAVATPFLALRHSSPSTFKLDCSKEGRLTAAALHYKAGCLLASIRICSTLPESIKFTCYKDNEDDCNKYSIAYKDRLNK